MTESERLSILRLARHLHELIANFTQPGDEFTDLYYALYDLDFASLEKGKD